MDLYTSGHMMETRLFSIKAALWIVLLLSATLVNAQGGGTCDKGWFGVQCQFVDLSYTQNDGTSKVVFRDGDDTTCNDDTNQQTATMTFEAPIDFTWLRLYIKNEGLLNYNNNIDVTFIDGNGNDNIPCYYKFSTVVDSRTIDIQCRVNVDVKKVAVTSVPGGAVGYLCSFYVSGGYNPTWFGSLSQYKCHCADNSCNNNGDCTDGVGCVKGWFGPQCQYVDLTYTQNDGTTQEEFTDADDTTCNDDPNHQTVAITFTRTFPFTWLRLLVSTEGLSLDSIDVTFTDGNGNSNIECNNRKSAVSVNSRTIDIHCVINIKVKKVSITGSAVGYLCSFFVSGGRNVALKQTTSQSTPGIGAPAKAVDGNAYQDFNIGGSCTHTAENGDNNPNWSVTLSQNSEVNRFVIYNRDDCCPERLKGFILRAYKENNVIEYTYKDEETTALSVYSVTFATVLSSISKLNIEATNSVGGATPVLTLCEVEIYGDTACPEENYGRECEHKCHCANNEPCFVSTGMCPNGCAAGFSGIHCDQPCPQGYYGADCQTECSDNCATKNCDTTTGRCDHCPAGKTGDFCNQTCSPTTWGPRCVKPCSGTCKNQQCDGVTGRCDECPSGKTGEQCVDDCPPTRYGSRCVGTCSTNCVDSHCSGDNGRCDQCPAGKTGDHCNQTCPLTLYGPRCESVCSPKCVNKTCEGESDIGRCIDCPSGMTGDVCDSECSNYTYGPRCIQNCSLNCFDKLCDGGSGRCNKCIPGKSGHFCSKDCATGKYGDGCKENCSINCKESRHCDSVIGTCFDGCSDGYIGDLCNDVCAAGTYGQGCQKRCSEHCVSPQEVYRTSCYPVNGTCVVGCVEGYVGHLCLPEAASNNPSLQSSSSDLGVGIGIGAGLMVVVVVALVVGVYCYRKRSQNTRSGRQRPSGYDETDFHNQDDNTYRELFKGNDDYNLPTDEVVSSSPTNTSNKNRAAYENTVVNPYDVITEETSRGEPDEGYVNVTTKTSCVEGTDGGYTNYVVETG